MSRLMRLSMSRVAAIVVGAGPSEGVELVGSNRLLSQNRDDHHPAYDDPAQHPRQLHQPVIPANA
jgi:hypothetical protein